MFEDFFVVVKWIDYVFVFVKINLVFVEFFCFYFIGGMGIGLEYKGMIYFVEIMEFIE